MSYSNTDYISADRQSIFSDTYDGVPSPLVPHEHPYPTRFHGPIYQYPRFYLPYREQSFVVPGDYLNPDLKVGMNGFDEPAISLGKTITGSIIGDAIVSAGIAFLLNYDREDRVMWASGGALAGFLGGTLGVIGTTAFSLSRRR